MMDEDDEVELAEFEDELEFGPTRDLLVSLVLVLGILAGVAIALIAQGAFRIVGAVFVWGGLMAHFLYCYRTQRFYTRWFLLEGKEARVGAAIAAAFITVLMAGGLLFGILVIPV